MKVRKAKCYHCGKKHKEQDMYEMMININDDSKSIKLCHKCYKDVVHILATYHDSY